MKKYMSRFTLFLLLFIIHKSTLAMNVASSGLLHCAKSNIGRLHPRYACTIMGPLNTQSQARCLRLKNNNFAEEGDITRVMDRLIGLATSDNASKIMRELVHTVFFAESKYYQSQLLQKRGIIDSDRSVTDSELDIIKSAIDLDGEIIDLSIIRSPLAGNFFIRPFALHEGIYDKSSYLYKTIDQSKNLIYLALLNPHYLVPIQWEKPLRRRDETQVDLCMYGYDGFWKQFGFSSYDEYLDDILSWEIPYEEWVAKRYEYMKDSRE